MGLPPGLWIDDLLRRDRSAPPKLTVLVPAFEDAPYLDEALASVARQEIAELEVVIADDASSDATPEIAEGWSRRDPRFRLVRNARNLGMTENWNRALAEATAPFVFKLDADDRLEPGTLSRMFEVLERAPEVRFAACRTVECDERLEPLRPFDGERAFTRANLDPAADHRLPGWRWFELSFDDIQLWHSSAQLHRTEALRAAGGWDATWSCASDTDLLLRVLADNRPAAHIGHVGVRYRRRAGSVSDHFERAGWKVAEAILVALRALERAGAHRVVASRRLRRNWWRLWSNARQLGRDTRLWASMPDRIREALTSVHTSLRRPPTAVCAEGWLRDRLWTLAHRQSIERDSPP